MSTKAPLRQRGAKQVTQSKRTSHMAGDGTSGQRGTTKPVVEQEDNVDDKDENKEEEEVEGVTQRTKLDLASHPLPSKEGLAKALCQLKSLQKLDVSEMKPSPESGNPYGLDSLTWLGKAAVKRVGKESEGGNQFGDRLTWLKFSGNPSLGERAGRGAWDGLEHLSSLTVLNATSCSLPVAPPPSTLLGWQSLGALILGHNAISSLAHFPLMPMLNTLVISHNKLTSLPQELPASLPGLKKISVTHNQLAWVDDQSPLPDFSLCSHLREVRISGNQDLGRLPDHLKTWGRGVGKDRKGTGLEVFEAGDCGFKDWEAIASLLQAGQGNEQIPQSVHPSRRRVRGLSTLHLKGNAVTRIAGYRQRILEVHPGLRVLDNEKVGQVAKANEAVALRPEESKVKDFGTTSTDKVNRKGGVPQRIETAKSNEAKRDGDVSMRMTKSAEPETKVARRQKREEDDANGAQKKVHKRGSRGKAKAGHAKPTEDGGNKEVHDPFFQRVSSSNTKDDGLDLARIQARVGPPVGRKVKRKETEMDEELARIQVRAGSLAKGGKKKAIRGKELGQSGDLKKAKASGSESKRGGRKEESNSKNAPGQLESIQKPAQQSLKSRPSERKGELMKRKAWDESEGPKASGEILADDSPAAKKAKTIQAAPDHRGVEKTQTPDLTSVAAIVNVGGVGHGKGKQQIAAPASRKASAPVWDQMKKTSDGLSLGTGGAWV